jgi:hypothetical protein
LYKWYSLFSLCLKQSILTIDDALQTTATYVNLVSTHVIVALDIFSILLDSENTYFLSNINFLEASNKWTHPNLSPISILFEIYWEPSLS